MRNFQTSGATIAPPDPGILQAARIVGRINVSPSLAGVLAGHAFGDSRRDHEALLVSLVASRVGSAAHVG